MTPDSEKPPPRTIIPNGIALTRVDIGLAVASVARSCWSEVERRAGMMIIIDAWGPVMADEPRVEKLLREMVLELTSDVPEGQRGEHVISLTARVGREDSLLVEVRHIRRSGVRSDAPTQGAHDLANWDRDAIQFAGRVELIADPLAERCYRLTLRLVNVPAQRS